MVICVTQRISGFKGLDVVKWSRGEEENAASDLQVPHRGAERCYDCGNHSTG